jgi:hypothetical protein
MSSLKALDVSVSWRRMSCILDGELALSRQGLLFAMRLAQEANVWLFRALWNALDNSHLYLAAAEPDAAGQQGRREASEQWESARLATDLAGLQFFFVGDARHESLLPKEVGSDLIERFEALAGELDGLYRGGAAGDVDYDPVYECNRDTIALAAALIRHRPIVFSLCARPQIAQVRPPEPAICEFLRQCGIECHAVESDLTLGAIQGYLQPIFARTGVAELLWDLAKDGYTLVVLHLTAPYAVVMPIEAELERRYGEVTEVPPPHGSGTATWFRGASAYWWPYA